MNDLMYKLEMIEDFVVICNNKEAHDSHILTVMVISKCSGRVSCGGRYHGPHTFREHKNVRCEGVSEVIERLEAKGSK